MALLVLAVAREVPSLSPLLNVGTPELPAGGLVAEGGVMLGLALLTGLTIGKQPSSVRPILGLIVLLAFSLVSLAWVDRSVAAKGLHWLLYLAIGICVFVVSQGLGRKQGLRLVVVVLLLATAFAVVNLAVHQLTPSAGIISRSDGRDGLRLLGITNSADILGATVGIPLAWSLALLSWPDASPWLKRLAWASLLLCGAALAWSLSRSGLIGFGLAVMTALWFTGHRRLLMLFVAAGVVTMLSPAGSIFLPGWQGLFEGKGLSDVRGFYNLVGRIDIWQLALSELVHWWTPFVGDGVGTTWGLLPLGTHSEVLQVWIEEGTPGLLLLLGGLAVLWWRLVKVRRSTTDPLVAALALAGLCALASGAPRLLWDWLLNNQMGWLMLAICGLGVGAAHWRPYTRPERAPASSKQVHTWRRSEPSLPVRTPRTGGIELGKG